MPRRPIWPSGTKAWSTFWRATSTAPVRFAPYHPRFPSGTGKPERDPTITALRSWRELRDLWLRDRDQPRLGKIALRNTRRRERFGSRGRTGGGSPDRRAGRRPAYREHSWSAGEETPHWGGPHDVDRFQFAARA